MKPTKLLCLVSALTLASWHCFAVEPPTLTAYPDGADPNSYELVVDGLPALVHESGYDFLWLFGDGQFARTTINSVTHTFVQIGHTPIYEATVTVYVSSRYSDVQLPPATLSRVVTLDGGAENPMNAPQTRVSLQTNHPLIQELEEADHSIVPGDVNVCVLTYANSLTTEDTMNGHLFFFYNENDKPVNEMLMDQHSYVRNEKLVAPSESPEPEPSENTGALLDDAFAGYTDFFHMRVKNLAPGEERCLALVFKIVDDIPSSWGGIFSYHAIFIPDGMAGNIDSNCVQTLNMTQMNVHDPNYLHVSESRIRWKTGEKATELIYTLYFENEGRDDARKVHLEMPVPPSLVPGSMRVLDESPAGCWKFTGTDTQLEWLVENNGLDSSINGGYIRFAMKTGGIREKSINSRAHITLWGANALHPGDSVYTNEAVTRVLDHWRLGGWLGFIANQYSGMDGFGAEDRNPFTFQYTTIGLTLIPHDPYGYFRYHEVSLSSPVFETNAATRDHSTVLRLDLFPYKAGYHFRESKLYVGVGAALSLNLYAWDQDSGGERYSILDGQNRNYQCWGGGLTGEASFPFILEDLRLETRCHFLYNTRVAARPDHWYYTVECGIHYTFGL